MFEKIDVAIIAQTCSSFQAWLRGLSRTPESSQQRRARRRHFRPAFEQLECRIVPSITNPLSIGGDTIETFTDSGGNVVSVRIAGSSGTVNFFDTLGGPVDDGDDIGSVAITGASKNFTLTYSADTAASTNSGTVLMGNITANTIILGVYSVDDSVNGSDFQLQSFSGINFAAGGGLIVDDITGDTADVGLFLSGGLAADVTINMRDSLDADLVLGDSANDRIHGNIFIGGGALADSNIAFAGPVSSSFALLCQSSFNGTVQAGASFEGKITIDGNANAAWDFNGGIGAKAQLLADDWDDVNVAGNFSGSIVSESSDVNLFVDGNLTRTAKISSSNSVTLAVTGNVLRGATAVADSGITFDIDGNMSGTFVAGSSELTGTIAGNVTRAKLVSSGDATVDIDGSVLRSTIAADGDLDLDVALDIVNSDISSGHSDISLAVGGNVLKSRFGGEITGDIDGSVLNSNFRATNFDDITLDIGGNLVRSRLETDSEISVDVTGSVKRSTLIATTGGVTLATGVDLLNSTLIASDDDIQLDIGRDMLDNTCLNDDSSQTWTVGRNYRGLFMSGSGDLTLTVGGSVLSGSQFLEGDDIELNITGNFSGEVMCDDLEFEVGGNVAAATRINVQEIRDGGDVDEIGFFVGGNFSGILNVLYFDANASVVTGQNNVLVGGIVTSGARLNIGDFTNVSTDETLSFGGDFLGQLNLGSNLDVDLSFAGEVNRVTIGGAVDETITVLGLLKFLSSGSLFEETVPGFDGDFVDGNGVVTGALDTTGGFLKVVPTV